MLARPWPVAAVLVLVLLASALALGAGCSRTAEEDSNGDSPAAKRPPARAGEEPPAGAPSADLPQAAEPPARTGPALSADEQAAIEKVMAARDEMADIAEAHSADCGKAARRIGAVVERNRELLATSSALEKDPVKRKWIGEKYGARMLASSSKLMALIEKCDDNEELTRVFQSLE